MLYLLIYKDNTVIYFILRNKKTIISLFKAMLSHRYGTKCLQPRISSKDFLCIKRKLNIKERKILDKFYELDENFVSKEIYLLKSEKELVYRNYKEDCEKLLDLISSNVQILYDEKIFGLDQKKYFLNSGIQLNCF